MLQLKALVIDDSAIMRKLVMRTLTASRLAQFTYVEAGDGQEGLEKFQEGGVEIVFVDWNMPKMTGVDFVRKAREVEETHTPIVMVTSEKNVAKMQEALEEAGADNYIIKPFTQEMLAKKLEKMFEEIAAIKAGQKGEGFFSKLASKLSA